MKQEMLQLQLAIRNKPMALFAEVSTYSLSENIAIALNFLRAYNFSTQILVHGNFIEDSNSNQRENMEEIVSEIMKAITLEKEMFEVGYKKVNDNSFLLTITLS